MSKRFEKAKYYTKKYKDQLFPCKYCGNTDVRIGSDRETFGTNGRPPKEIWYVACMTPECDTTGGSTSVRAEIQKWNERHGEENDKREK